MFLKFYEKRKRKYAIIRRETSSLFSFINFCQKMNQVVCRLCQLLAAGENFQAKKINFVKIVTTLLRIQK
jgi:hypothetical protein